MKWKVDVFKYNGLYEVRLTMTFASVPSHWAARKDLLERAIVRRNEKEARYRQSWDSACQYFDRLQLRAVKHDSWTSDELYKVCNEAYLARKVKEKKQERLAVRRAKLLQLLQQEEKLNEAELEVMKECQRVPSVCDTRRRLEDMWIRKDANLKSMDERKLNESRIASARKGRQMESQKLKQEAINSLSEQLRLQDEHKEIEERCKVEERKRIEQECQRQEEERVLEESQRLAESCRLREILRNQVEVLKLKEAEAARLKREQDLLLQKQWFLDQEVETQRQWCAQAKRKELGCHLRHQCKVQLQQRAKEISEELEKDQKMLEQFAKEQSTWSAQAKAPREKAIADALAAQKMIDDHKHREKNRRTEVENLFNEEAARLWLKRETEWENERQMRQKLMKEVMDGLRLQIQERIAENLKMQEASIREREDLLRDMEAVKAEEREKYNVRKQQNKAWRKELKDQMLESLEHQRTQMNFEVQKKAEKETRAVTANVQGLEFGDQVDDVVWRPSSIRLSLRSAGSDGPRERRPSSSQLSESRRRYAWT